MSGWTSLQIYPETHKHQGFLQKPLTLGIIKSFLNWLDEGATRP
jgi:hypothetical protein